MKDGEVNGTNGEWSVPSEEVLSGGPGKDGIPSIDNPIFINVSEVDFLSDDDLLIGVYDDGELKAYPHPILDWHEIVNDEVGTEKIALTYCPLTGTAIAWDRILGGEETTFGVSGLLYNSNLIPYDRKSDSNWSQMGLDCINGERIGQTIRTLPIVEMAWSTWKVMYPDAKVLSLDTGFSRDYAVYPYGDYKTSDRLLFGVDDFDSRLDSKERVLGVIGSQTTRAYRLNSFNDGVEVLADDLDGIPLILFGSADRNFLVAYEARLDDGTILEFTTNTVGQAVAEDNEGNKWDVFGRATSGPRTGTQLKATSSFIGYWFSWGAFYEGLEIYGM